MYFQKMNAVGGLHVGANWVGVKDVGNNNQFKFVQAGENVPATLWYIAPSHVEDCAILFATLGLREYSCTSINTYACEPYLN